MNVLYSYPVSLNAMNCISIHEFFSGCWAETEITILSPCTLLSWHSSSVWSTDRRHRSVSDPHFWDPERDRIRHVVAADNHLQCRQTLSHSGVMLSFCTDCSHTSSTISYQFHFTMPRSQFLFICYFDLHFLHYLIKKFVCKACGIVYFFITNSKVWRHSCKFIFNAHSIE